MPALDPALAAVRLAVRRGTDDLPADALVLVACSGGGDSLALLAASAFELPRAGHRCGTVVVDHRLQPGSAQVAAATAARAQDLGAEPVRVVTAHVGTAGGPEAAARTARYAALTRVAADTGAAAVLLGHTRDDQAETVLLGLARGSGARSLAGMRPVDGRWRRPLLALTREQTRLACAAAGLHPWDDPHNDDDTLARARVRRHVLPALERDLGPGVAAALARTADLLRSDADLLDSLAAPVTRRLVRPGPPTCVDCGGLAAESAALRTRVLLGAARAAGSPPAELTAGHVHDLDALVTGTHGGRGLDLPGGVRARRCGTDLLMERPGVAP